jgi:hypothetical protein
MPTLPCRFFILHNFTLCHFTQCYATTPAFPHSYFLCDNGRPTLPHSYFLCCHNLHCAPSYISNHQHFQPEHDIILSARSSQQLSSTLPAWAQRHTSYQDRHQQLSDQGRHHIKIQDQYHFQLDIIFGSTSVQARHHTKLDIEISFQDRYHFQLDIRTKSTSYQDRYLFKLDIISRLISFPAWYQIKVDIIPRSFQDRHHFKLDIISSLISDQGRHHTKIDIKQLSGQLSNLISSWAFDTYRYLYVSKIFLTSTANWSLTIEIDIISSSISDQGLHHIKIDIISSLISDEGRHYIKIDIIDIISSLISFPAWF